MVTLMRWIPGVLAMSARALGLPEAGHPLAVGFGPHTGGCAVVGKRLDWVVVAPLAGIEARLDGEKDVPGMGGQLPGRSWVGRRVEPLVLKWLSTIHFAECANHRGGLPDHEQLR